MYYLYYIYIYIYILCYINFILLACSCRYPSTRSIVIEEYSYKRELFCHFNWCFVATGSCFVTSIVVLLHDRAAWYFNCCVDATGNRQAYHMRQNCATCLGQRQAHIESVTWQVNRIELFSHFNRCFVARVSCIVTSTVASMQLAICRPGI